MITLGYLLLALLLSLGLCAAYLWLAQRWQIMDVPNERSAHHHPVPRGGGAAIFLALIITVMIAPVATIHQYLMLGVVALVALGLWDDIRGLGTALRLLAYASVSVVTVWLMFGNPWWVALAALYVLWLLNLYNFIDGIDALASSQAVFTGFAAAALTLLYSGDVPQALLCVLLALVHTGFLLWNRPPARLFMGDSGSVTTGYLLAALSLHSAYNGLLPLSCWLILLAAIITDASYTLLSRLIRGERFWQAHNSHAYQRLSRHWGSHGQVVSALMAMNVLCLLPLATLSVWQPVWAPYLLGLAYLSQLLVVVRLAKFA